MTNDNAAWVLKEYIRANSPCNGLLTALQMGIAALEHSAQLPESVCTPPQVESLDLGSYVLECDACHAVTEDKKTVLCPKCGAHVLKPVYTSDIGREP
jgi:Zn finger protein HypA/HybF involved in hydrogenase expression